MVETTCGCEGTGDFLGVVFCPKHAAVDDLIAALEFLLSVVPDNRLTREAKQRAQDAIRKTREE